MRASDMHGVKKDLSASRLDFRSPMISAITNTRSHTLRLA